MTFADNVYDKILESIRKFFKHGINSDVILLFTIKEKQVIEREILVVDSGWQYFETNGYFVNGLKSYTCSGEEATKHGYIIFETQRILTIIGSIAQDLDNIAQDLNHKML